MKASFGFGPRNRRVWILVVLAEALVEQGAITGGQRKLGSRALSDNRPGFPCRVSLRDADAGDTLVLVHFEHHPVRSPYRASHAIYIREGVQRAALELDEIPEMLESRLLSVRAFDDAAMLVNADVVEGRMLACRY